MVDKAPMMTQTNGRDVRRFRCAATLCAALATSACFLPNPPVGEADSTETSAAGSSSGGAPTTSGGEPTETTAAESSESSSSSGADSTTTGEAEDTRGGTTEFSLPECPYVPLGGDLQVFEVMGEEVKDVTLQACGEARTFERVLVTGSSGSLTLAVCDDAACDECDTGAGLEIVTGLPDPFDALGSGVAEGKCVELGLTWERPTEGEACRPSRMVARAVVDGAVEVVPAVLYRVATGLDVTDELGGFALTAVEGAIGPIHCPCACAECRDEPGSRFVEFSLEVGGMVTMGEPLQAEQAQEVPVGMNEGSAVISLVRANYPSDCGELPTFEWVFRHPGAR